MFKINKLEREYLEQIGALTTYRGQYPQMYVCNVSRKSKKKTYYINDDLMIYLNPDLYREKMKPYMKRWDIEYKIKEVLSRVSKR